MLRFFEASISATKVKVMVHKLFESFLDDKDEYSACERYWESLVSRLEKALDQEGQWPRWIARTYADGSSMEPDGNPMFDGRSDSLNRAFTIIQHVPAGNEVEIAAWVKAYEPEYSDLPNEELVINLSLSEESAALARNLLREVDVARYEA